MKETRVTPAKTIHLFERGYTSISDLSDGRIISILNNMVGHVANRAVAPMQIIKRGPNYALFKGLAIEAKKRRLEWNKP